MKKRKNDLTKPTVSHISETKVGMPLERPPDGRVSREKAEEKTRNMEPDVLSAQTPEGLRHELRAHRIELEMQNEELRTAEAQIEAWRACYFDLYDQVPVGYCTLSEQGLFIEANLTAATLLGTNRDELIEQPISRFILNLLLRWRNKNGSYRYLESNAVPLVDKDGTLLEFRGVDRDITERKRAEEKLCDSELFFHTTINSLKGHICVLDETGKIVLTNQAWDDFAIANSADPKCVSEDVNYLSVCDSVIGPDLESASSCSRGIRIVLNGDSAEFSMEYPCHSPTEKRWFLGKVSPLQRKDSKWVVINHENITERKLAEEALQIKNQVFEDSIASQSISDNTGTITHLNQAFLRLWGYTSKEQAIGNSIGSFFADEAQAVQLLEALASHDAWEGEFIAKRRDGTTFISRGFATSLRNTRGEIIGYQSTNLDMTEQKQTEEALQESEQQFRLLFQHLDVGVVVHAPDTEIILANEKACKLLGLSVAQMTGKTAIDTAWCFFLEDETAMSFKDYPVQRVLATRRPIRDLVVGVDRPNTKDRIWVLVNAFPELDAHERLRHAVVTFVDITECKQAEDEKEKLHAQLTQAQKMEAIGTLAGGIAHDFNNMLGVISGRAELGLKKIAPTDPVHKDLEQILNAAGRSADITRQLLAFARKQTIAPMVIDMNHTLGNMIKMLGRLIAEDIDLLWQPADDLWMVKIDPSQLDQILVNLCVNARDAIADVGKITIETGMKVFDTDYCDVHAGFVPGEFVLLAVSDDGCGMDRHILDNLFEPFFTTKETGRGTGMGLATVYGIVKQNNGFINVYSELEKGSSFRIYLPRHTEDMAEKIPEKHMATSQQGSGETILLVEDETTIMEMLEIMLESLNYTVIAADSPSRAMEMANSHAGQIHLVITDVVMPEMNGRDLAEKLSSLYPGINILFMSGYAADVIAHQGVLDDGVAFIQKPFSMADLAQKVRVVLDMASDKNQG
jgi:PAS domain S-box-containing protein